MGSQSYAKLYEHKTRPGFPESVELCLSADRIEVYERTPFLLRVAISNGFLPRMQ